MGLEVGMVVAGKVTGIKKFGAFVTLEEGGSGLVHISEISNSYVEDINEHLQEGQEVKVKVKSIDENGRIDLSIKRTQEPEQASERRPRQKPAQRISHRQREESNSNHSNHNQATAESSFEDKLKQFMQESNSKFSGVEMLSNRKGSSRRKSR